MDDKNRFKQLGELMADRLVQQDKTIGVLQDQQASLKNMAENSLTTQAFNNAFVAILDKFQRVEEKQDQRWAQLMEKLDKMSDHEDRL